MDSWQHPQSAASSQTVPHILHTAVVVAAAAGVVHFYSAYCSLVVVEAAQGTAAVRVQEPPPCE